MAAHASIDKVRGRLAVGAPAGIRLGPPRAVGGLTLVPIFHDGLPVEYELFAEAQQAGTAEVTEVGAEGAVALIDADPNVPGAEIYRVGDLVAGARLVAITDSSVTLAQPSGPLVLRLQPAARRRRP